ncbi:MAG: polyprenyl synthetase family protein [Lentimonas sp.]
MIVCSTLSTTPDSKALSGVLDKIEGAVKQGTWTEEEDVILAAFRHHFSQPGKCMRAQLCMRVSSALGHTTDDATAFAATVEALHNASLVLDDLQDAALSRRGQSTVCAQFGSDAALALTFRLTAASFLCLRQSGTQYFPQLSSQTRFAVAQTALGQARDLDGAFEPSVEDLKKTAALKSGPLFGLSLSLPLIAAGYECAVPKARRISELFGLGYQLLDDIKDRSTDRLQNVDSNIVNAYEKFTSRDGAVEMARLEAKQIFDESKRLANELPVNSGLGIIQLIQRLKLPTS